MKLFRSLKIIRKHLLSPALSGELYRRLTDALGFYEAVAREANFSDAEKQLVRLRWIVCKNRQLEYEHEMGGGKSRRALDVQRELSEEMTRLGIKQVVDLPRYPALYPIEKPLTDSDQRLEEQSAKSIYPTHEIPETGATKEIHEAPQTKLVDRVSARFGDLSIDLSRQIGRCNITHGPTMQTAYVNLRDGHAGGEKQWQVISPQEWVCDEWRLRAIYSGNTLQLTFDDIGACFSIDLPLVISGSEP